MEFHSMQVSQGHLARAPASVAGCGAACAARPAGVRRSLRGQNGCPERLQRQAQRPAAAAEAALPAQPPAAAWRRRQWRRRRRRRRRRPRRR
jgi:hypothetical protein